MDYKLSEIIEKYLSEMKAVRRASDKTLIAYKHDIEQFNNVCKDKNIDTISKISDKTIRYFIMELNEDNLNKSSISRKLSAIRGLFNFAVKNKYLENNPAKLIKNPRISRTLPETINLDSLLKIYKLVSEFEEENRAELIKIIFELLYGCALRVSELCDLNIQDLDLHTNTIRVLGKGSKIRMVPIGAKSLEIVNEYIKIRDGIIGSDPLIVDKNNKRLYPELVYRIVRKYLTEVTDIKKRSPHILRHSAATHMLDNNADLLAVKEILGHENLSTTQIYTHVSIERLKNTYKKAHPKS